jgi:3D (Asp-Asp-Asp) domain-containing protein
MGVFTMAAVMVSISAATSQADALYILTGASDTAIVLDGSSQVTDLSSQRVNVTAGSTDLTLTAGQTVVIERNGETKTVKARRETISALLERVKIKPSPLEMVAVDLSGENIRLTVAENVTYYETVQEDAAFVTLRVANDELPEGTEKVVQEGADGVRTSVYEVVWSNGEQVSRQLVEELDSTAVDEIIEYGTASAVTTTAAASSASAETAVSVSSTDRIASVKKNADGSGTLVFDSGATLNFTAAKSMTATAYTAGHGGANTTTATGTIVNVGTVAVDKNVIPLGTRMYIVTNDGIVYGTAVARDTGVRGNIVDLYYNTYSECVQFGRRSCTVYILE